MTIAEKITRAKTDYDEVYEAGKQAGGNTEEAFEAGKQAAYDEFWDDYQVRGSRKNYLYAFAGTSWTDKTYNPKYTIEASENASFMFCYSSLPNTKVPIDLSNAVRNFGSMFANSRIVTIPEIIFSEKNANNTTSLTNMFTSCSRLENITVEGVLALPISFQWCPLSHDSLMSIINALKDYSTDTSGTTRTLTIGTNNYAKLTEEEIMIARNKGWEVV